MPLSDNILQTSKLLRCS